MGGFIAEVLIFVAVIALGIILYDIFANDDESRIQDRIQKLKNGTVKTEREKIENSSIIDRLTLLAQKEFKGLFTEKTSKGDVGKLQAKIMKAGLSDTTDVNTIRAQRLVFASIFGFVIMLVTKNFAYALAGVLIGAYYPSMQLDSAIKKRQEQIKDEIPEFLDLLAATYPGSKGFEDAIDRICKRSSGVIVSEFKKYVDEINAGKRKKEALKALADRCNVKEIDMLVNQIIQSEALGTGLEDTLISQAKKLRILKKTQAEIKAKKASTAMLSSVLFSITAIMIIVGGPAMLQIMEAMG